MKFTVYVKNWARGGEGGLPALLNDDGNLCCLGFACRQLGFKDSELLNNMIPSDLTECRSSAIKMARGVLIEKRGQTNTKFSLFAADINDDKRINDKTRMQKLRALAKKYGHQFIFSNK